MLRCATCNLPIPPDYPGSGIFLGLPFCTILCRQKINDYAFCSVYGTGRHWHQMSLLGRPKKQPIVLHAGNEIVPTTPFGVVSGRLQQSPLDVYLKDVRSLLSPPKVLVVDTVPNPNPLLDTNTSDLEKRILTRMVIPTAIVLAEPLPAEDTISTITVANITKMMEALKDSVGELHVRFLASEPAFRYLSRLTKRSEVGGWFRKHGWHTSRRGVRRDLRRERRKTRPSKGMRRHLRRQKEL